MGALLHRAGNYAVVDRGVLYAGEQWPMSFDRFQVISFDQERVWTYGLLDAAVRHADDLLDVELFALQESVVEGVRLLSQEVAEVSNAGIACHIIA